MKMVLYINITEQIVYRFLYDSYTPT